jgi:diacylglycerol kinase (ATP)
MKSEIPGPRPGDCRGVEAGGENKEGGGVRIALIIRPRAGPAELEELRTHVAELRGGGHEVWPRLTFEEGDARRLGRSAAEAGAELIVAVGGDGTLNEVVNGILATDWAGRLAVLPNGTANDFAAGLGIPDEPGPALEIALNGVARAVDVGTVNGRHFVNVSTGGFGATATEEAPAEAKRLLGPMAYVVTGVRLFAELAPAQARFEVAGIGGAEGSSYEGAMMLFAVGNGRQTGGGNLLTPRAELDDGLLDVVVVPGMTRMEFLALLPDLRSGAHLDDPDVRYFQTPRLVVVSEAELSVNADGEPVRGHRFEYTVADRQLTFMMPA